MKADAFSLDIQNVFMIKKRYTRALGRQAYIAGQMVPKQVDYVTINIVTLFSMDKNNPVI